MEFRILGPLEVVREGAPLPLRAAKHRSLLALLLLHANELVSYERLFDELWGERPPATARTTLQVYVSALRKALGAERIISHPRGYELRANDEEVDATRFQRLLDEARKQATAGALDEAAERFQEALGLWRGPALAGADFASFAANEVERLEELRLQALAERIDCKLRGGHPAEVIAELEALVGEHPLNERFRAQLMLALYRQGRQADALAAYREARRALVDELGIEPGPELRDLNRAILEHDPVLAPPPVAPLPSGTVTLLASDVEGSTQLLQELGPRYQDLLRDEQHLLRSSFTLHGGREVDCQGESFLYVFARVGAAALAAAEAQRALADHAWPAGAEVQVRMGIHTGEPALVDERFVGLDVHRVARISQAGHGGQILLSREARELVKEVSGGIAVRDLGTHRLKDLREPERLFQLSVPGLRDDFPPLRSLQPTNLPSPASTFVGRERELTELRTLLLDPTVRLLSLTGAGGSGKTRLALELAAGLLPAFPDGAFFVSLASLAESDLVLPTIAQTLSLKTRPGEPVAELLERSLQGKELLLVLDNFEHLLPAGTAVASLLSAAPQLKLLVTSRAALRLLSEHRYEVPPLALPDLSVVAPALEELAPTAAVRLFCERAKAVRPQFELTEENAPQVAGICVRLDGLPLALELAAARVNVLSPAALLPRLDQGLDLLSAGARDRPARQQTMRATIEWSERLLDDPERTLFRRLSVFAGGFSAQAAQTVCGIESEPELDVFEGLSSLVEKSLLRQEDGTGEEPRFSLLEPIREYAHEQLADREERDLLRHAHADYYAELGRQFDEEFWWGTGRTTAFLEVAVEADNLRAAMVWSREAAPKLELALAIAYQLTPRVPPGEGQALLEGSLARAGTAPSRARARALAAVGGHAVNQGHSEQARPLFEESLSIYRDLEDPRWTFLLLRRLGAVLLDEGDIEAAKTLAEEAHDVARRAGIDENVAWAPMSPADLALDEGDYERAHRLYLETLRFRTQAGDEGGIVYYKYGLALVALQSGRLDDALDGFAEPLTLAHARKYRYGMRMCARGLAAALAESGEIPPAVRIFAAMETWSRARGLVVRESEARLEKRLFAALFAALETGEYADDAAEGATMTVEAAATLALDTAHTVRAGHVAQDIS